MPVETVDCTTAFESDGTAHLFEVRVQKIGAPYRVVVDEVFLATEESLCEAREEIDASIAAFGWTLTDPWDEVFFG